MNNISWVRKTSSCKDPLDKKNYNIILSYQDKIKSYKELIIYLENAVQMGFKGFCTSEILKNFLEK